jgi:hypothetical protein
MKMADKNHVERFFLAVIKRGWPLEKRRAGKYFGDCMMMMMMIYVSTI